MSAEKYAVIVDAGSSGSRVYVYSWPDVGIDTAKSSPEVRLPQLKSGKKWTRKISPGISTYHGHKDSTRALWRDHLQPLVKHAQSIVPHRAQPETPIFVLATAGMRLLPESDRNQILQATCKYLTENTSFYLPECETHVSVIDGGTEGLYGWLALNYLLHDKFNTLDTSSQDSQSYGFMDMGGASAQIAFAPNTSEVQRHQEDLYTVRLRSLDGVDHETRVFVSTWLGFGANQARTRFSEQLITMTQPADGSPYSNIFIDPCSPLGLSFEQQIGNDTFMFEGSGSFATCLSQMIPLLNKDLKCTDEPCLFNGVHVPAIDFTKTKFVGVSEYWYTAEDVFDLGGKYNVATFSANAGEYCELSWAEIKTRAKKGGFHGAKDDVLKNACFKASWIINVLHQGFGLPVTNTLTGGDSHAHDDDDTEVDFLDPFQSVNDISDHDLSWTLGRALLYASSQIKPDQADSANEGPIGFQEPVLTHPHAPWVVGGEVIPYTDSMSAGRASMNGSSFPMVLLVLVLLVALGYGMMRFIKRGAQTRFILASLRQRVASLFRMSATAEYELVSNIEEGQELKNVVSRSLPVTRHGSWINKSTPNLASVVYGRPLGSVSNLGTTSSMVDLNMSIPARVNSRTNMRDQSGRAVFTVSDNSTVD